MALHDNVHEILPHLSERDNLLLAAKATPKNRSLEEYLKCWNDTYSPNLIKPLQSRRNDDPFVWTKAFCGMVFRVGVI